MLKKKISDEEAAKAKLIREIDSIDDDKNKIGRYVLIMFAVVFILAAILLAVILLNPQAR